MEICHHSSDRPVGTEIRGNSYVKDGAWQLSPLQFLIFRIKNHFDKIVPVTVTCIGTKAAEEARLRRLQIWLFKVCDDVTKYVSFTKLLM